MVIFSYDGSINRDLKEVGKALKRMTGLKELFVSFSRYDYWGGTCLVRYASLMDIKDQGMEALVEVLKRLKGLQILTIKFIG